MLTPPGATIYCLSPRCALCNINFIEGDNIVTNYEELTSIVYSLQGIVQSAGVQYNPCSRSCSHPDGVTLASHSGCVDLLSPATPGQVIPIAKWEFEPDFPGERERRLQDSLASRLAVTNKGVQGFKVRSLQYRDRSTKDLMSWSTPQPLKTTRFVPWCHYQNAPPVRMLPVFYNTAGMTGISVRCNPTPSALFVHTAQDDLSFYKLDHSECSVWVYVPLKGELIRTIWMRHGRRAAQDLALAFETDKERCILLGPQGAWQQRNLPWTVLDRPDGKLSCFYFDCHRASSQNLAFDSLTPTPPGRPPTFPEPVSPRPPSLASEDYFWSSVYMQGVVSVRQCGVIMYGLAMVIGLEFQYIDGSVATVGQVRRDRLGCAWAVSASDQLWLEFRLTKHKFPYVACLQLSKPAVETEAWFRVAWTDLLEWWFSTRQCQVWQSGRASLRTMI